MGSNSTKQFVNEEKERHTEVDKIVQIVQLENGLNKKTTPSEVQSFAEVHLENNNLDSISEIISSIPLENNLKKIKAPEKDKIGAIISGKPRVKDTEVDDAIAELEETFRTLDKEKSLHSSAPPSSSPSSNHSSVRLPSRSGNLNVPSSSVPPQSDQQLIPFDVSPRTAGSSSSWESLHSPETQPTGDCRGSSKPNTGPPMRAGDQFLPRRPHLPSRASVLSQRSRSQNGRITTAGVYSPASQNPHRPYHQSSLSRLHQQHSPRGNSSQIIVIQQQNQRLAELLLFDPPPNSPQKSSEWIYQPPKIEGFDIDKFKELNHRKDSSPPISYSLHMPRPREDYLSGSMGRSRESPDYTKDELELIASLEREIF